jgi:deoxyribonuclease V
MWPVDPQELMALQLELAAAATEPWRPPVAPLVAACWVSFPRGLTGRGGPGDPAWTAAVTMREGRVVARHEQCGAAGAAYVPGLLALRLGPLCEAAVRALRPLPDVVLLDATGRDHPRHGGLALHLGAALDLPSVGTTHRPLLAHGDWPADKAGALSPLFLDGVVVGYWLRSRAGMRPIAVHAGWRTDPETATAIVRGALRGHRTPEPLREARHLARLARAQDVLPRL